MRYLYSKDGLVFAECDVCKKVMKYKEGNLGQISEGVECFCGNVSDKIDGMPLKENIPVPAAQQPAPQRVMQQVVYAQPSGPRCPTCQSTNIQKISLTSKAVGGYMFGIFSSNVRNRVTAQEWKAIMERNYESYC